MRRTENDGNLGFERLEDRLLLSTTVALVDAEPFTDGLQPGVLVLGDLAGASDVQQVGAFAGKLAIYDAAGLQLFDLTGVMGALVSYGPADTDGNGTPDAVLLDILAGSPNNGIPIEFASGAGNDSLNIGTAASHPLVGALGATNFGASDVLLIGNAGNDSLDVNDATFNNLDIRDSGVPWSMAEQTLQAVAPALADQFANEGGSDVVWLSDSIIFGDLYINAITSPADIGHDIGLADGLTVHGAVRVYTGGGDDTVIGIDNTFDGPVFVDMGDGNDLLVGSNSTYTQRGHDLRLLDG